MAANLVLKRGLSLSTIAQAAAVRVPVQVHGVEGRYASALYTAAIKQNVLPAVEKDLQTIKNLYTTDAKFKEFVLDPTLNALVKTKAVNEIAKSLKVSSASVNFVSLLAENGRLSNLGAIINAFETILRAHKGELSIEVTSAEPLTAKHADALKVALQKFATSGQTVKITFHVKPTILGGLVVNIGDKYVDLSIASRVKKYTEALQQAI